MSLATTLVFVLFMLTNVSCSKNSQHVVYLTSHLSNTTCISNQLNDICPVDYKVPDRISNIPLNNRDRVASVLNSTSTHLRYAGGNESCINASKTFECSKLIYKFQSNLSYVYLDEVYGSCMSAKQKCSGVPQSLRGAQFNCTLFRNAKVRVNKGVT